MVACEVVLGSCVLCVIPLPPASCFEDQAGHFSVNQKYYMILITRLGGS